MKNKSQEKFNRLMEQLKRDEFKYVPREEKRVDWSSYDRALNKRDKRHASSHKGSRGSGGITAGAGKNPKWSRKTTLPSSRPSLRPYLYSSTLEFQTAPRRGW